MHKGETGRQTDMHSYIITNRRYIYYLFFLNIFDKNVIQKLNNAYIFVLIRFIIKLLLLLTHTGTEEYKFYFYKIYYTGLNRALCSNLISVNLCYYFIYLIINGKFLLNLYTVFYFLLNTFK